MKTKQLNLIYAFKDNELTHISQVERGLKCDCVCPSCNATLIARKGERVIHHFAHYNTDLCKYVYETSLHLAAKEIISSAKSLWLPAVYLNFDSGRSKELVKEATEVTVDGVRLEKGMDDIIPDIIVKSGGKEFIIEICVTHAIDDVKLKKIANKNISTLEIDLSKEDKTISKEDLKEVLLENSELKYWRYNALEEAWRKKFYDACEKKEIISRGFVLHIDNCPIKSRTWKGKPYANFIDDCMGCEFFISQGNIDYPEEDNGFILCSGKERISHIDDFKQPLDERHKTFDGKQEQQKYNTISDGRCPNCGGTLVPRKSKFGEFMGCDKYPHCRFTLNIDTNTGEIITKS